MAHSGRKQDPGQSHSGVGIESHHIPGGRYGDVLWESEGQVDFAIKHGLGWWRKYIIKKLYTGVKSACMAVLEYGIYLSTLYVGTME